MKNNPRTASNQILVVAELHRIHAAKVAFHVLLIHRLAERLETSERAEYTIKVFKSSYLTEPHIKK